MHEKKIYDVDISGSKQPGNDIDVYLESLIEELKRLWKWEE